MTVSQLNIASMLFLSTAHLRPETAKTMDADRGSYNIENHPLNGVLYDCIEFGYLVWSNADEVDVTTYPEEIAAAVRLAKQHGCHYIKYDCDVEPIDQLPKWEW